MLIHKECVTNDIRVFGKGVGCLCLWLTHGTKVLDGSMDLLLMAIYVSAGPVGSILILTLKCLRFHFKI